MMRSLWVLLLLAGIAPAQEQEKEKDDSGISVDETPTGAETPEPERKTANPARVPGKKPATVVVQRKVFSLALPADWVLQDEDDPKAEVAWNVLLPGSSKRAGLFITRDENLGDPRSAPARVAEWYAKDKPLMKAEAKVKPWPRLVTQPTEDTKDWITTFFYAAVRGNPYVIQLSCTAADFAQAEADMLAAMPTFTAKVELWPPIPKGYEVSQEGPWLVARAPSVTAPLAPLVRLLKEQERRFKRDHGPLPKGEPIVVLVHATKDEGAKIEPRAGEDDDGVYPDTERRRLFALPIAKDNLQQEAALASGAQGALFGARYGDWRPVWVWVGEITVARAEAYSGKQLPVLDEGFVNWASTLKLHTLDNLEQLRKDDHEAWQHESFFYVAMFHAGKHKKAYDAFLDDYAQTGDAEGALARHILPIGMDQLRDATHDFVFQKIKTEKREQKK